MKLVDSLRASQREFAYRKSGKTGAEFHLFRVYLSSDLVGHLLNCGVLIG